MFVTVRNSEKISWRQRSLLLQFVKFGNWHTYTIAFTYPGIEGRDVWSSSMVTRPSTNRARHSKQLQWLRPKLKSRTAAQSTKRSVLNRWIFMSTITTDCICRIHCKWQIEQLTCSSMAQVSTWTLKALSPSRRWLSRSVYAYVGWISPQPWEVLHVACRTWLLFP